jgi:uncharacterized protein (TIGR00252 family)
MSTATGKRAEDAAAAHLESAGYRILARNWRTRWCEIDIIAVRQGRVSFIEVKYRANDNFGDGLSYITLRKQEQMAFAASFWIHRHSWQGDYHLAAVSVTGPGYEIEQFIDEI